MLEFLRIRNLALIQDMELEFHSGLNVLTGESGAGKSFILRALDFILGDKLGPELVRPDQDKASVEAIFVLEDEEILLRRELTASSGRSRVFVNDGLSSQERIRELKPRLVIHTSQHAQQRLLKPGYHTSILDSSLPGEVLKSRSTCLEGLREVVKRKEALLEKAAGLAEKRDYLEYQHKEIARVNPQPGEEEELEARRRQLQNQSQAQESLQRSLDLLHGPEEGLYDRVVALERSLQGLMEAGHDLGGQAEALEGCRHVLSELDRDLRRLPLPQDWEKELEKVEARLWQLAQLKRRLGKSLSDIGRLQSEVEANLSFLDECQLQLTQLEREEAAVKQELGGVVAQLNTMREQSALRMKERLEQELRSLGFSEHVSVLFELFPVQLTQGIEELRARLMWVPNPGHPPQPLDQIASGGELSRFLLALVGLQSEADLPTLLFDEVDAGIGGLLLGRVGERLQGLSRRQQVILVSHWPQLASLAGRHFQVSKEVVDGLTFTRCVQLDTQQILGELARMAGGGRQGELLAEALKTENGSKAGGGC